MTLPSGLISGGDPTLLRRTFEARKNGAKIFPSKLPSEGLVDAWPKSWRRYINFSGPQSEGTSDGTIRTTKKRPFVPQTIRSRAWKATVVGLKTGDSNVGKGSLCQQESFVEWTLGWAMHGNGKGIVALMFSWCFWTAGDVSQCRCLVDSGNEKSIGMVFPQRQVQYMSWFSPCI